MVRTARYGEQSTAKVISAWARKSSKGTTTYEILLHSDGILTCNCPGWVQRSTRDCKHVKELVYVAGEILSSRRSPIFEKEEYAPSYQGGERFVPKPAKPVKPAVGVGRLIEREDEGDN